MIVSSDIYGDTTAVARNFSSGGMALEMIDPLPLGTPVTIRFRVDHRNAEIAVRGEIKHQYFFNYGVDSQASYARGIGVRFIEFLAEDTVQETGITCH